MLLIDGDVLCYNACPSRYGMSEGVVKIELNDDGTRKELVFSKDEDRRYLENAWDNFKDILETLKETHFCEDFLMAVKGPDNFRNLMYPDYKMNRHKDPSKTNQFVPVLRKLAVAEDLAVEAVGREADDLLSIWATEAKTAGVDTVICSIDKDLLCIPGAHYLMHKKTIVVISELEATRHFYEQLLKGDPTDNIPGVPRVGNVKAARLLENVRTEEEMQEVVVRAYIEAYDDAWLDFMRSNGKMLYLQKHPNDYFDPSWWPLVKELR